MYHRELEWDGIEMPDDCLGYAVFQFDIHVIHGPCGGRADEPPGGMEAEVVNKSIKRLIVYNPAGCVIPNAPEDKQAAMKYFDEHLAEEALEKFAVEWTDDRADHDDYNEDYD